MNFPEVASGLVGLHLFPLLLDLTSDFKETVTFERALDHFVRAVLSNVSFNVSSFDLASTLVSAFHDVLGTLCGDVLFHVTERKAKAALEQALHNAIRTLLGLMIVHVLP